MSAAEVAAAAERLREAGRELEQRPGAEVLDAVGAVLDAWRDPEGAWQRELVTRLTRETGFSEANVARGLALGLADWSSDALRALYRDELGARAGSARGFPLTAVVLAGAIPMPSLLQILLPLALRSPVLVKPASRDRATPALVAESLRAVAPALAPALEIVDLTPGGETRERDSSAAEPRDRASREHGREATAALLAADCVVASGSDASIDALGRDLGPAQRFVAYGHRLSIAVLGPHALDAATARAVGLDIALWDQLGCLSPVAIHAVGCSDASLDEFANALAHELAGLEKELPRGTIGADVAAQIRQQREEARFRFAASTAEPAAPAATSATGADAGSPSLLASQDTAWTVVREVDATPRPTPLHRFVRIHPVADAPGLERAVTPFARHLSCAAIAGFAGPSETQAIAALLQRAGASRVCPPGRMQAPPLDWPHDGAPVLLPLARLSSSEASG